MTRILLVIMAILMIGCGYGINSGVGKKIGQVVKMGEYGAVCTTYEGELVLSSIASTSNVAIASEKFFFSVADKTVARKMEAFEGKHVKLHYVQKNGTLPWRGESQYIVDGVEGDNP